MQATPREMAELAIALNEKVGFEIHKAFERGVKSVPKPFDQVSHVPVEMLTQARAQLFDQMSALQTENEILKSQLDTMTRKHSVIHLHAGQGITLNGIDTTITEGVAWEVGTSPPLSIQVDVTVMRRKSAASMAQGGTPLNSLDHSTMPNGVVYDQGLNDLLP